MLLSALLGIMKLKKGINPFLVVCAPGGHLTVARELFRDANMDVQFVLTARSKASQTDINAIYLTESNRDWRLIIQFFQSLKIIFSIKPKAIVSTGAGVAIPFFIWAKLFRIKTVFVESASRTKSLSWSGAIAYRFVDRFYVRNKSLSIKYPKAVYCE